MWGTSGDSGGTVVEKRTTSLEACRSRKDCWGSLGSVVTGKGLGERGWKLSNRRSVYVLRAT